MKSKLFSLIVSVLAAMCLWVYVMTVVNPDVDLTIGNIPVTFSGAEVLREDHGDIAEDRKSTRLNSSHP